jgi:glutamate synthase (NADPH/NADH) large chain
MSGGAAYVLDLEGTFRGRCNTQMVDLESLDGEAEAAGVHELVARHVRHTGSAIGGRVLDAWPSMRTRFVAVTPRDFKRVQAAEAQAKAESRTPAFRDLVGA